MTDELRLNFGDTGAVTAVPIGSHFFSAEALRFRVGESRPACASPEGRRAWFLDIGPYVLASTPGGRDELRPVVDPEFADLVDELATRRASRRVAGPTVSSTFAGIDVVGFGTHVSDR